MKKVLAIIMGLFLTLVIAGCGKSESIVIYSSMEEERNQALKEQIKEKFPDLNIVVQQMATGNVAAKIENEKENIEADIILGLETSHMENLKDYFADLSDFSTDIYEDGVIKSNKYYIWDKYTMNLIIDNKYFKEHKLDVPKTYEDLLKKDYKNLISMPDPSTSGTGYAFYLNAVNIMGEKDALAYFKKLKGNVREFTTSGSGPTNLLKQGEIAIAMGMTSQGAKDINDGYDFKIVTLESGAPYNTTSISIIKDRENKENLKEVFEWILNDFNRYDKENFMPDVILKNQKNNVDNYPTDLKMADMKGIDDNKLKDELTEKWSSEING